MTRSTLRPLLASVVAALALVVAACGGSNSSSSGGSSSGASSGAANQETGGGKTGGVLRQLGSSDVDYLDPGHTYYTVGYQLLYPTQRTL